MKIDFSKAVSVDKEANESKELEERTWRNSELSRADIQLLKVEDGAKGIGTQKAWREYRNALRDYPNSEDFLVNRPTAPDTK